MNLRKISKTLVLTLLALITLGTFCLSMEGFETTSFAKSNLANFFSSPPLWATPSQISTIQDQNNTLAAIMKKSNINTKSLGARLSNAYAESKALGDTDSTTLDKLIAAMHDFILSTTRVSQEVKPVETQTLSITTITTIIIFVIIGIGSILTIYLSSFKTAA